jgi:hypothetical protein
VRPFDFTQISNAHFAFRFWLILTDGEALPVGTIVRGFSFGILL